MPWEEQWGATDGRGNLKVRFPPTAFYMMQVGGGGAGPQPGPMICPGQPPAFASCRRVPSLRSAATPRPRAPPLTLQPVPPACLQRDDQTRRQIEAAIRIFKRNRVPADYVYVSAGGGQALRA